MNTDARLMYLHMNDLLSFVITSSLLKGGFIDGVVDPVN